MTDISNERHFTYTEARRILNNMFYDLIKVPYPCVEKVYFKESTEESFVKYKTSMRPRSHPVMRCQIGIEELVDNMDSGGYVRDVDLVWAGKHITHEADHSYNALILYQNKDLSGRDLDMARMDAIGHVFDGYHKSVYEYMLSELKADKHGFINAVRYFDKNIVNSSGRPVIDAKACLVQRVRELPDWRGDKYAPDYDAMVASLDLRMDRYKYESRGPIMNAVDNVSDYLSNKQHILDLWKDVIYSHDRFGIAFDEKLFSLVLDVNPVSASRHPCLDKETDRIRAMYPSRLDSRDRIDNKIDHMLGKFDSNKPAYKSSFRIVETGAARDVTRMAEEMLNGNDSPELEGPNL